jgi:hypothetical protein
MVSITDHRDAMTDINVKGSFMFLKAVVQMIERKSGFTSLNIGLPAVSKEVYPKECTVHLNMPYFKSRNAYWLNPLGPV